MTTQQYLDLREPGVTRFSDLVDSSSLFLLPPITETQVELVPELEEIGNAIEEVVDLTRQINLEMDSDDIQELLNSHNPDLVIDEFIKMPELEQGIEEMEYLDLIQLEDRIPLLGI
ncbi:hypothetical protein TNCV_3014121 [Trichonephila clavipes]|nr:hypothetical protein TNCV_3014121 [Trichonephila clavipes]